MSVSAEGFARTFKYIKLFEQGLICTVSLSALTVIFGFVLALLLALFRLCDPDPQHRADPLWLRFLVPDWLYRGVRRAARLLATVYVEFIRATPLLVQLFIVYYVIFSSISLPTFKLFGFLRFDRFLPGVVALSLNSAAYTSEIIRAGIQSIDLGQTEASRSLGLTQGQTMRYIILPQAIKNILPAIGNEFVTIIKESSICYTIGVQDIMYAVTATKGAAYIITEPLLVATAVYFCLTYPTSKIIGHFERKMSRGDKR